MSPTPPHSNRLLLEQIPCERLPTDYDRATRPEEQAYGCGIVHSSLFFSLPSFFFPFQHQQQQQQQQQRTSNSIDDSGCDDDDAAPPQLPNAAVTLITLYGILMKRYVREPEIMLAVALKEEEEHQHWVGVPLDGVVGLEISIADAVRMVDALLRGRVLLKIQQEAPAAAAATATSTPTNCLSSQAFVIDGSLSSTSAPSPPPPPCTWPVLSFSAASPSDWQSDLCLVVKKQQQEDDDVDDAGPPFPYFTFVYNTHLFSKPMMEAMMRSWETLLIQTAAAKNLSVRQDLVPVVSAIDEKMMANAWNQTDTLFSWSSHLQGIHQLFEACVDEGPSRVAVVGPSSSSNDYFYPEQVQELTYGELDKQANRLAYLLSQQQQRPFKPSSGNSTNTLDDAGVCIVAILMERSVDFYVAMLAVLKAGAAYLSIDTDYPDERIHFMLQDSGAVAVVTTQALIHRLAFDKNASCEVIVLDEPAQVATLLKLPSTRLSPSTTTSAATSSRLCYVIYTSGSTGKPKGVQISQANVLNLICGEQCIYQVRPSDRVLQGFSTSFDASVEEIWMAFSNGAALVVGTKDLMRSGPDFPHYLKRLGVTCLSTVPTLLATLHVGFQDGHHQEDLLPGVRLIITGGEACSKELVARWASRKGRRFFNTYGPTETTVIATCKEYSNSSSSRSSIPLSRISIGRPLANYQCYVVDGHMNLLPPGALGELVIGGASVSQRGYLNLPDKTKSVFVHDHLHHHHHNNNSTTTTTTFANRPLLYKSGDLARFSMVPATSGEIEYHGRVDTQMKIRGYRVEPSEIESVLSVLPGIKNAIVDVQQQAPGAMKHLVAFVIPSSSSPAASLDTAGLLQALREKLPAFMMPSHIEVVASFPTLPSGKVDRRRLPQVLRHASRCLFTRGLTRIGSSRLGGVLPVGVVTGAGGEGEMDDDDDDEQAEFDGVDDDDTCEPTNQNLLLYRKIVAETFEAVLELPPKTLKNSPDFFDLGGNSLLVSLLVTKLRRHYPAVTARNVYGNSTVKGLAQVIAEAARVNASANANGTACAAAAIAVNHNTSKSNARSGTTTSTSHPAQQPIYIPSRGTTFVADLVQFAAMYFLAAYMGMNGFVIYTLYFNYKDLPTFQALVLLGSLSMALIVLAFVVLVVTKWLVLGRVQEGDYPLWQSYHLRFWFVQSLDSLFQLYYMPLFDGTPLVPFYHWMLGVQMGRGVYINGHVEGYDLVTIGDGCSLNCDSNLSAMSVEGNYLKLRKVSLGKGVTLGTRAVVQPDVDLNDYCKILDMSLVPSMTRIPCHQTWGGSPIAFVETGDENATASPLLLSAPLPSSLWGIGTLQIVWAFLQKAMEVVFLVPFLYLIRTVPVLSMMGEEQGGGGGAEGRGRWFLTFGSSLLHLVWLWTIMQLAMFFVGSGLVALLKRLLQLLGGGEKDSYPLASFAFFRRWLVDNLMGSLTVFTKQLRGTVYLPLWYRLMGAKVGRHAEISAFENVCAERLTLKDYVFVADDVIVGLPHVDKGMVTHGSVSIGRRSFVGNNSVVQARTSIVDNVLVGVLSLAPKMNSAMTAAATDAEEGENFLGSPPFQIQRRAVTGAGGLNACAEATTYDPPIGMLLLRYLVEGLGFVLLQVSLATCFALLYVLMSWLCTSIVGSGGKSGLACYLLSLPFFIMGAAGFAALLTLFWKWTVIGRFKAGSYPLYGTYVWRTEFVERIEENLLQSYTYPLVTGTVWMQWVCQAMGVRMGRRAYLDSPYFCEPDLCTVGDYLNMERMASLQAHLFQDRVRTTGPVKVGDFCSLGSDSVVLVGGVMGDHCSLSSLSLVLRSEELPPHTQWHGLPAIRLFQHHDAPGAGFGGVEVEMGSLEEGQRGK